MPEKVRALVRKASTETGFSQAAIVGRDRYHALVKTRHAVWKAAYDLGFSYPEVGALFDRDHTSIMHGIKALNINRPLHRPRPVPAASLPAIPDLEVPKK